MDTHTCAFIGTYTHIPAYTNTYPPTKNPVL